LGPGNGRSAIEVAQSEICSRWDVRSEEDVILSNNRFFFAQDPKAPVFRYGPNCLQFILRPG
jgi:hypothetical protein